MKYKRVIIAAMLTAALLFCAGSNIAMADMKGACKVVIPIENVTDKDRQDETFSFRIEKSSDECPAPEKNEVRIRGSGSSSFVINVEKLGRFDYTIRDGDGRNTYHVIIASVRNERNEMRTSLIITDGGTGKPEKIVFTNLTNNRKKHDRKQAETGDPFNERLSLMIALSALAILLISIKSNRKARKKSGIKHGFFK